MLRGENALVPCKKVFCTALKGRQGQGKVKTASLFVKTKTLFDKTKALFNKTVTLINVFSKR